MSLKLAVSNIAWDLKDDPVLGELCVELGVEGVEVAPTKIWPRPLDADPAEIAAYREFWAARGIAIPSLQALLFGRSDLSIFANDGSIDYLTGILRIARTLGARVLVFGSPKNRQRGARSPGEAQELATAFFRELGRRASEFGCVVCIEPNPPQYACDFITTSDEGWKLVEAVGSPGFGLHLDVAAMQMAGEDVVEQVKRHAGHIEHVHFSAPNLEQVRDGLPIAYGQVARVLKEAGYSKWISIEMRPPSGGVTGISETLRFVRGLIE